jgi:hypothetical protein
VINPAHDGIKQVQCRLILAAGQCDAEAKTEFHGLLPVGMKNWRGLSQISGVLQVEIDVA